MHLYCPWEVHDNFAQNVDYSSLENRKILISDEKCLWIFHNQKKSKMNA